MRKQGRSLRVVIALLLLEVVSFVGLMTLVYVRHGALTPGTIMSTALELPALLDAVVIGAYSFVGFSDALAHTLGRITRVAVDLTLFIVFIVFARRALRERRAAKKSS
ncbi:MAG: hypothetical protein Athens041674_819 [Parcubacteria group bacterium Athens0416_74]|nr:MAG: hypothetical protein Athens041674_819 [Parcubacteria group bacterium Athens0416_74]